MGIPVLSTLQDPIKVARRRDVSRYALVAKLVAVSSVISCPFWLAALFFPVPKIIRTPPP